MMALGQGSRVKGQGLPATSDERPATTKPPVSVVIIAKNEERNLPACLASVTEWASEILVVDDHSTDRTRELATAAGARVLSRALDIEGRHRNWAYAQASQPWVLSLDADERVTPALAKEITNVLARGTAAHGFSIPLRNYIGQRPIQYGGWYPAYKFRLFLKDKCRYEEAGVHPRILMDDERAVGTFHGDILHYGFKNFEDFVAKQNRQTTLEAEKWAGRGRPFPLLKGVWRALDRFWRAYLLKQGWREGFLGFMLAYLGGLYQVISYAKYWELRQKGKGQGSRVKGQGLPATSDERPATRSVPLSVVIITKNEEARIAECLASVGWAQEVIVVDDESTDRTRELATASGARVLRRTLDIEGRHRNWAYAQASQPWVLSLDADERVTPELAAEIARVIHADPPQEAFGVPRKNYIGAYWVRHGGWYPADQLKLFRRGYFQYEEMEIHPKSRFLGIRCGVLAAPLEHFSYRDVADFLAKLNAQSTREAQKWAREGRRMPFWKALWRALDRGTRAYVWKQGFRDGFIGLLVAEMAVCYQLLSYAKYWELRVTSDQRPATST